MGMIEVSDGLFVNAEHVAAIKSVGENQCALFTCGQSAMDGGFLIDRPAIEVATDIEEELREADELQPEDD